MKRYVEYKEGGHFCYRIDTGEGLYTLSDLISQVPEIREKLAECLYMSKAQRDCAEKFFKEKLVHWKDLEIREKNWDIIKDYWYALADSILQLFRDCDTKGK